MTSRFTQCMLGPISLAKHWGHQHAKCTTRRPKKAPESVAKNGSHGSLYSSEVVKLDINLSHVGDFCVCCLLLLRCCNVVFVFEFCTFYLTLIFVSFETSQDPKLTETTSFGQDKKRSSGFLTKTWAFSRLPKISSSLSTRWCKIICGSEKWSISWGISSPK